MSWFKFVHESFFWIVHWKHIKCHSNLGQYCNCTIWCEGEPCIYCLGKPCITLQRTGATPNRSESEPERLYYKIKRTKGTFKMFHHFQFPDNGFLANGSKIVWHFDCRWEVPYYGSAKKLLLVYFTLRTFVNCAFVNALNNYVNTFRMLYTIHYYK